MASRRSRPASSACRNRRRPAKTFLANSQLKALAAAKGRSLPALADDSGLCVDALGGAPGVYSARWSGPARDFAIARAKVEEALAAIGAKPPFTAHFICVLTLAFADGAMQSFEGRVDGELVFPPRGSLVFGYDPIFLAEERDAHLRRNDAGGKAGDSAGRLGRPVASGPRLSGFCEGLSRRLRLKL